MVRMEEFTDHKDTTVNSVQLCSLQFSSVLSFRSHVEMLHVTYGDTLGVEQYLDEEYEK